ncbi:lipocalin family protein [Scleromatobacter humisilvae]|uniref:Outer membrane lipoprotein Blc n=1 Tax=Scleromatobacter humisilvae TaxID=2897159 RepID=A0A9X1YND0_9BURK|nr:lipocalin family protein [Scleromatobacter humisilvae]MCK9689378.1 lipocalin family protein [Scleromatobacter humisilvae]
MSRTAPSLASHSIFNVQEKQMRFRPRVIFSACLASVLAGCASAPAPANPLALVPHVDLARFMGDWYVIASIPTWLEKGAHNPKESYRLNADGSVATTFSFNADSADGPVKTYTSKGIIVDPATNAIWGQQYVWPFKADYRISYLSADYGQVVIARDKRDYVWIMSRSPTMSETDLQALTEFVRAQGYDTAKLQRVPQSHADVPSDPSATGR